MVFSQYKKYHKTSIRDLYIKLAGAGFPQTQLKTKLADKKKEMNW